MRELLDIARREHECCDSEFRISTDGPCETCAQLDRIEAGLPDSLDAERARHAALVAAAREVVDRSPVVTDGETGSEWCHYCDAWANDRSEIKHHLPTCEWAILRASVGGERAG